MGSQEPSHPTLLKAATSQNNATGALDPTILCHLRAGAVCEGPRARRRATTPVVKELPRRDLARRTVTGSQAEPSHAV
eukprot:3086144-Pyramimonas_sp.AAC.1